MGKYSLPKKGSDSELGYERQGRKYLMHKHAADILSAEHNYIRHHPQLFVNLFSMFPHSEEN